MSSTTTVSLNSPLMLCLIAITLLLKTKDSLFIRQLQYSVHPSWKYYVKMNALLRVKLVWQRNQGQLLQHTLNGATSIIFSPIQDTTEIFMFGFIFLLSKFSIVLMMECLVLERTTTTIEPLSSSIFQYLKILTLKNLHIVLKF